jgi:hypothetical protein
MRDTSKAEHFSQLRATSLALDEYLTVDGVHPRPGTIAALTNFYGVEKPEDIQNLSVDQIQEFQRRQATAVQRLRWALYKKFGLVLADGVIPKEPRPTTLQMREQLHARRRGNV